MISLLEKLAEIIPARFVPSGLRMAYASVALAGFVSAACNSGPSRQEIITAMATPTAGIERVIATPYTPVKAQFQVDSDNVLRITRPLLYKGKFVNLVVDIFD